MIGIHPSFPQPSDKSIKVWRYMDIAKFIALIQTGKLYFARSDRLGDPFEGSVPRLVSKTADYILEIRQRNPDFEAYTDMDDEQLKNMFQSLSQARKKITKKIYINCWHMNEHESEAMWRLYSKSNESVCVQARYDKLSNLLSEDFNLGMVTYIEYDQELISSDNLLTPFMHKRKSYEHEKEIRAVTWDLIFENKEKKEICASLRDGGIAVRVNLNELIDVVYVNPLSPDWFRNIVESICRKYEVDCDVRQSKLIDKPLY